MAVETYWCGWWDKKLPDQAKSLPVLNIATPLYCASSFPQMAACTGCTLLSAKFPSGCVHSNLVPSVNYV